MMEPQPKDGFLAETILSHLKETKSESEIVQYKILTSDYYTAKNQAYLQRSSISLERIIFNIFAKNPATKNSMS